MYAIFQEFAQWHRMEEATFEIFYASDFTVYTNDWAALDAVLGTIQSLRKVHLRLDNYDVARARWRHLKEYPSSPWGRHEERFTGIGEKKDSFR